MNKEEKIFIRKNLIKLVIWLVLLGFSFSYIQNHPAEKASIFSGFQVLWQRTTVYVNKLTNNNPEALQKKYDYEKTYQELIHMAENQDCEDTNVLIDIKETYLELKREKKKTLEENLPWYIRKANEYKHIIEGCDKE